jgi:hypothetical protein
MTDPFEPTQPTQPAQSTQPGVSFSPSQPRPSDPFASSPTGIPGVGAGAPEMAAIGPSARRQSRAASFVNVLLGVALVVAVGGVAFAAGRATAPAPATANRTGFGGNGGNGQFFGPNASGAPNRGGGFAGFGGAGGGVSIQGTVTAVSADSISLQLASGQTVTIPLDSQTTYHSRTSATASQVTDGATVIVQLSGAGRGAFGGANGGGNGQGGGGGQGPTASGAPGRALGSASSVTIVPAGS